MSKVPQTIKRSDKDELLMYILLLAGVSAVVLLFLVNILLIDKIMENTINENIYLKQDLETRTELEKKEEYTEIPLEFQIEESELPE